MAEQFTDIPRSVASIWLVRGPGMVLKVVLCERDTTEAEIKRIYRQSINCRRTDIDMEPDMEWPVCQVIARDEVMRKYPHLLQFSSTRDEQPRVLWIRKPETKKTEAVK